MKKYYILALSMHGKKLMITTKKKKIEENRRKGKKRRKGIKKIQSIQGKPAKEKN